MDLKEQRVLKDILELGGGKHPRKTKIIITDHETGEVLQEVENKILVPGSQITACKEFGITPIVNLPTYNTELKLENSKEPYPETQPTNDPIICLWCVGRSGAGPSPSDVIVPTTTDRIAPTDDIIPFRYVNADNDLPSDLRDEYYGRAVNEETGMISYYFKAFDTEPQLHVRYLDGTEVTENMYTVDSSQQVEVYVEVRLALTRIDLRDYFDQVLGWDKANISCISLCTAWFDDTIAENPDAPEEDQVKYKWYQDILPFSKLNFQAIDMSDLNWALDFNYQVYY